MLTFATEQRPKLVSNLQRFFVKPRSSRRRAGA